MGKEYTYSIITKEQYDYAALLKDINDLIAICKKHQITTANLSLGYAWEYYVKENNPKLVDIENIPQSVENFENLKYGILGDDDLFLEFNDLDFRMQYCHHGDLHLFFNEYNEIIKDIIKNWENKNWKFDKFNEGKRLD